MKKSWSCVTGAIAGLAGLALSLAIQPTHTILAQSIPQMSLTAAALGEGFTLRTFADAFTVGPGQAGPLDVSFVSVTQVTSAVLITERSTGTILRFATDRDGQRADNADVSRGPAFGVGNAAGLTRIVLFPPIGNTPEEHFYMAQQANGTVVEVNPGNGTIIRTVVDGIPNATGIVTAPYSQFDQPQGRLFVSQAGGEPNVIWDVDPATNTKTIFLNEPADGMDLGPDGKTLYLARADGIKGFDTVTGQLVFESGPLPGPGSPDGVVVGKVGTLNGNLFVNTTGGLLVRIKCQDKTQTVIGTGGSRGDFIRPALNGCSLLLSQSDSFLHVVPPGGLLCPFRNNVIEAIPIDADCP